MVDFLNSRLRRVPTWVVYALGSLPFLWLVWLAFVGGLGVNPVETLEHELGLRALQYLVAVLAITPLRRFAGLNLIKFRRALGLLVFFYVLMHLVVWLVLDVQIPAQIWADIIKRPYITIGFGAFLLMVPLALTSNNLSIRKLGKRWRQLHKLTYAVAVMGAVHFVWLVKGFQIEPLVYLGLILILLALRLRLPQWKPAKVPAKVLAE